VHYFCEKLLLLFFRGAAAPSAPLLPAVKHHDQTLLKGFLSIFTASISSWSIQSSHTNHVKGSLAVPIEEPFEEPFLVAGRTLSTEGSIWKPKRFYLEPKRVLPGTKIASPMGTAKGPF
jgi:hypothetical protein